MKPFASLSLDLDNQWSYMKIHGDDGWQDFPSYLDIFVPHVLRILRRRQLRATFFIVGQDAALEKNRRSLQAIAAEGHEIGNHSFRHESWLHFYGRDELERELQQAEESITRATGCKPTGFRGPGFSWSPVLLDVLFEMGYRYDASTLPTYLGPLARMYYFRTANLSAEEKAERGDLFGRLADGKRANTPYLWDLGVDRTMLEIPVTTMPIFKTPFHLSYLLYLSRFSVLLMQAYLGMAIALCRMTRTSPSFLLHPLDLVGGDQISELAFFPGMDVSSHRKTRVFEAALTMLEKHFAFIPMGEHAELLLALPLRREPVKSHAQAKYASGREPALMNTAETIV